MVLWPGPPELLASNDRSKCPSLRTIILPSRLWSRSIWYSWFTYCLVIMVIWSWPYNIASRITWGEKHSIIWTYKIWISGLLDVNLLECLIARKIKLQLHIHRISNLSQKYFSPGRRTVYYIVSQKKTVYQCYFLNNSVKHWPMLIIFGMQHHEETWRKWL